MKYQSHHKNKAQRHSKSMYIIFGFFAIAGCLLCLLGRYTIQDNRRFMETAVSTTAQITRIDVSYDSEGDADHDVYVKFKVNDKYYEGRLNTYTSSMHTGGTTEVFYQPDNPARFRSASNGGIFFLLIGVIFALIGIIPLTFIMFKGRRNRMLLANGRRFNARIIQVYENTSLSVNGCHPYKIICQGYDHTGELREFKSINLWSDPSYAIEDRGIKSLPVYINEKKPKKYYIDIECLLQD